jgi:acyl-[acyl-carrier-protein] desaturase
MGTLTELDLLRALEPVVGANLERHLTMAREWMPHEYVPWSRGRDFTGDGASWTAGESLLPDSVRAAFEVNLLTEDNLPSYHHELAVRLGLDGAWGTWVRRWTAEEGRHATAIRDYLMLSRAVDPIALERDRMATMQAGWSAGNRGVVRSLVYVTLQELATRISHRNTGLLANDPAAERLLARVAADENLHMLFYRNVVSAALELSPELTLPALAAEVRHFQMPGASVPGFLRKSVQIADAGIFNVCLHRDEVIVPLLRHWQFDVLSLTDDVAKRAQEDLVRYLRELDDMVRRYEERRDARRQASNDTSR